MAYKALYRKYRPIKFSDVVGQDPIIKTLKNTILEDRIGHAYLFSGPRGTGKTSVAKLFAKTVNCEKKENGDACNECLICKEIINSENTDIIEIDAASNNGVDEIRELKGKINISPSKSKYKIYIIDEVHMLSIGAFNALLKTLEEPPGHVIFVLATTEFHKLPLTIISRCQVFNFKKINKNIIVDKLIAITEKEKISIDIKAVEEIAKLADGGLRDAIGILEQLNSFANEKITLNDVYLINSTISLNEVANMMEMIINNNLEQLFVKIEEYYNEGKDFVRIAEKILIYLRDLLLYKSSPSLIRIDNTEVVLYEKINNMLAKKQIFDFINKLNADLNTLKNSSYPKILFDLMMLKLLDISNPDKEVNDNQKINEVEINGIKNDIKNNSQKQTVPVEQFNENQKTDNLVNEVKKTEQNDKKENNNKDLRKYKEVLINNTIAKAEKEILKIAKEKWNQLNTFLINKDLKNIAVILMDAQVNAVSSDHMILTYKYENTVDMFYEILAEAEKLVNKIMGNSYKLVAISEEEWLPIRNHYINLKKSGQKVELLPEDNIILEKSQTKRKKNKISNIAEEAINTFGDDLVEMKG